MARPASGAPYSATAFGHSASPSASSSSSSSSMTTSRNASPAVAPIGSPTSVAHSRIRSSSFSGCLIWLACARSASIFRSSVALTSTRTFGSFGQKR